ncbi:LysR family transcriptional regulator [Variovorax sp. Varisp85]|jgi:DNA-binding transcriptional LysR family regulator|uniref:LysR family transcriptional regulator n=1 Tax=unclassified Variovorax TaxID=663243 RepID=UPI0002712081|nr:LysR family transcriptional regulator [Variovorax sp. CF313]EJL74146.1 transcriptional regulator [Variovorax sp. CF313]
MNSGSTDASLMLHVRPRQLLLLARLDAHRHLGRAAEAMNISQPAATKLLQQLEDSLGEKLFERLARGMEPTPYGEILIRYARRVLSDFGTAREEMLALRSGLSGALRVGSVPGAVPELLAPALVEYHRRHPQVAVSVVVETSDVIQAQLEQGDVDLVLGRLTDGHDEAKYASVPLLGESQVVVVRIAHPVFDRPTVTLAEMANWSWVLQPPGSPQRGRFEAAMREAGIQARLDIIETASPIAITALLESSDMAAVMPASQASHYARLGVLRTVPVELPVRVPPICLITREDRALSPAAAQFRRQLLGGG